MFTVSEKDALFIKTNILSINKATHKSYQESKLLQAYSYTSPFSFLYSNALKCIKRASFPLTVTCTASISIEASVAIPIFIFCFLEILSLLNYLSVYSGVLYAMKSVSEPIAIYSYAYDELQNNDKDISVSENMLTALVFSEGYLKTQIQQMCDSNLYHNTIKGGTKGIYLLGSRIDSEESCLDVVTYYTVKPIIDFAGTELFFVNRYYTRMWTGYDSGKTQTDIVYVYITQNGNVYHLKEDCTHLKLSISRVDADDLYHVRNESGEKYSKCIVCIKDDIAKDDYYITKQGNRYHMNINCPSLKRTIYCVEKEEVENWLVCSRCIQMTGDEE